MDGQPARDRRLDAHRWSCYSCLDLGGRRRPLGRQPRHGWQRRHRARRPPGPSGRSRTPCGVDPSRVGPGPIERPNNADLTARWRAGAEALPEATTSVVVRQTMRHVRECVRRRRCRRAAGLVPPQGTGGAPSSGRARRPPLPGASRATSRPAVRIGAGRPVRQRLADARDVGRRPTATVTRAVDDSAASRPRRRLRPPDPSIVARRHLDRSRRRRRFSSPVVDCTPHGRGRCGSPPRAPGSGRLLGHVRRAAR